MRHSPLLRTATLAVLVASVLAASGCSWFRKNSVYQQSAEARPLEVPPDLDRPNTSAALGAPASVTRSTTGPSGPVATPNSFSVQGERDAVFEKLGAALAAIPGVTIASKAQLLGTYDVTYEGANFLVRTTKTDAGIQVSAVDPRGVAATGDAPTKLLAALRTALSG